MSNNINIGINIFNHFKDGKIKNSSFLNKDGFIVIKQIDKDSSAQIDTALNSNGIVFDSAGNVWDASKTDSPIVTNTFLGSIPTPEWQTTYSSSIIRKDGINSQLTSITDATYFVSQPDVDNNNIGGWLLYKEETSSGNMYYILYNPLNRNEIFTVDRPASLYQTYCNKISIQDPNCYCLTGDLGRLSPTPTDTPHNYCYFSSLDPGSNSADYTGKTLGLAIEDLAQSNQNQSLDTNINTIKAGCNCLGTCKNNSSNNSEIPIWKQFISMFQIGQGSSCENVRNIDISACLSKITAGGNINDSGGVFLQCASGQDDKPITPNKPVITPVTPITPNKPVITPVTTPTKPKNPYLIYYIIAVILIIIIAAYFLL